ncbi:MAG: MOSC domain-containing protein [Pseudomonadota bacterium]
MPILAPTKIRGTVCYLGLVADRRVTLASDPVEEIEATFAGLSGEYHSGLTRASCSRVTAQYPKGTEIRNTRQATILSREELAVMAEAMELPEVQPQWLGANIVIEGIPDLTQLPPASRLIFEEGASLTTDVENGPCKFPAELIDSHHPGHGRRFIGAARGRRGLLAWVERPGPIRLGMTVRLHAPPQRLYPHL